MRIKLSVLVIVGLLVWLIQTPVHAFAFEDSEAIPGSWDGQYWLIMPLREEDSNAYFRAHQSSAAYLYRVLGWGWPTRKISPEVNFEMVRFHVEQHASRESFTYVIRARGEREIAGAIYVNPVNRERRHVPNFDVRTFDAEVTLWVNQETESHTAVESLLPEVLAWLDDEWRFNQILLPVFQDYEFMHAQLQAQDHRAFTLDGDSREQLYRIP